VQNVEGGDLSGVVGESVPEGHVEVVPGLDSLVLGGGDADSGLRIVVELEAGNGIGVPDIISILNILSFVIGNLRGEFTIRANGNRCITLFDKSVTDANFVIVLTKAGSLVDDS
jgi:hypothetical protein